MKKLFLLAPLLISSFIITAQSVGIGTSTPHSTALMHIDVGTSATKGFLVTGNQTPSPSIPDLGAGTRLIFYPGASAFRVGQVSGTNWDNANVGRYSVAFGLNTKASGINSTAMGNNTVASGLNSTAMGSEAIASAENATAMGYRTLARGSASTAMGDNTDALGYGSTTMGGNTYAEGQYATAMGYNTYAIGQYSTTMGYLTTANGQYSTAIGYNTSASGVLSLAAGTNVSTNNKGDPFFFGDGDPNQKGVRSIGFADQFAARFNGGYYFISSDAGADIGVQVLGGGNAWITMSDERKKENLLPVNGEIFLQKIANLKLTSWNYKSQDAKSFRHYGPMAQDFYAAFGKDGYGAIGNDTTINQADFDGVSLIAIQALEKRTTTLIQENKHLKNELEELKTKVEKFEKLLATQGNPL